MGKRSGWEGWTETKVKELQAKGTIRGYRIISKRSAVIPQAVKEAKGPGAMKYDNQVVYFEGIRFDSIKERRRYIELRFLEQQGLILDLRRQVPYELNADGSFSFRYIADFVYIDVTSRKLVVEDAKGCRTKEYRKKAKLMVKLYGIVVNEV